MSEIDTNRLEQVLVSMEDQEIVMLEAKIRAAQLGAELTVLNTV